MKKMVTLFADLDGTLIRTVSGCTFPKACTDFIIRKDVLDAIRSLPDLKVLAIVTNQGGIPQYVSKQEFVSKLRAVGGFATNYIGHAVVAKFCASTDPDDPMRKPNPGMLEYLVKHSLLDLVFDHKTSLMIGDASGKPGQFSDSDYMTAQNFHIDYMDVDDFVHTCKFAFPPRPFN